MTPWHEFVEFNRVWQRYLASQWTTPGQRLVAGSGWMAEKLYQKRGKWARPFSHVGMASIATVGLILAPVLASGYSNLFPGVEDEWNWRPQESVVLAATTSDLETLISDKPRDKIETYEVQPGDTLSIIATKFGIDVDTVIWENDLGASKTIKPGQTLRILPVQGVRHKVKKGETVYSIAKKYEAESQPIVDFPFNSFANDETFALAVGQELIVPGGQVPQPAAPVTVSRPQLSIPAAGTVAGSGQFAWPTGGRMTQQYSWYHKAVDIANRDAPTILAADSGVVVVAGWPDQSGYGNRVIIDHGNGFSTLYAHMQVLYTSVGQTVNRGEPIGKMGSTGRSTGTHLHFEIRTGSGNVNPMGYLK